MRLYSNDAALHNNGQSAKMGSTELRIGISRVVHERCMRNIPRSECSLVRFYVKHPSFQDLLRFYPRNDHYQFLHLAASEPVCTAAMHTQSAVRVG